MAVLDAGHMRGTNARKYWKSLLPEDAMAEAQNGRITQVIGPVVDVGFPAGQLPHSHRTQGVEPRHQ